jgi:hypothetical protein
MKIDKAKEPRQATSNRIRPKTAISLSTDIHGSESSWDLHFRATRKAYSAKSIISDPAQEFHMLDVSPTSVDLADEVHENRCMVGQWTQSSFSGSRAYDKLSNLYEKKQFRFHISNLLTPKLTVAQETEPMVLYVPDSNGKPVEESPRPPIGFMDQSSRPCSSQPRGYLSTSIPQYYELESTIENKRNNSKWSTNQSLGTLSNYHNGSTTGVNSSNFLFRNINSCESRSVAASLRPMQCSRGTIEPIQKRKQHGKISFASKPTDPDSIGIQT